MGTRELFRENLRYYRKQKGLTQEKLSELIGFGETYITEIESRHKFPKPETLDIIARILGIEPYRLFQPLAMQHKENPQKITVLELQKEINIVIEKKLAEIPE